MASHLVVVTVAEEAVEEVSGDLWGAGVIGIEERSAGDGWVQLRAGLAGGADPGAVTAVLDGRWAVAVELVEGEEWLDTWQAHAATTDVGQRLRVHPVWLPQSLPQPDRVEILLPPHRAFGTGAHPTTTMVLEQLEMSVVEGMDVLDVGCGAGLLAVAAARLGAARVVAIDVDAEAVRATAATARVNRVEDVVEVSDVPLAQVRGRFDLVLANIGLGVLVDLLPDLAMRLAPSGALVLSGVLEPQADELLASASQSGLVAVELVARGGWAALVMQHR